MSEMPVRNGLAEKTRKAGLRTGYTTGTCAAAAAKAATVALLSQSSVESVQIKLPIGEEAFLKIKECRFDSLEATCSVVKDAGDDPDVTNGAEICATVNRTAHRGIQLGGGKGVGTVTKPGLGLAVGDPAINSVPRKMILTSIEEVAGSSLQDHGIRVIISVPHGEEIAKKTLNARLGILGGISILGTTGIVYPYSASAYKACIVQALDVARESGNKHIVFTTGGRSEKFAEKFIKLPEEAFIQMGDFVGFAMSKCSKKGFQKATVVSMVGKITKIASGNSNTNANQSSLEVGFLVEVSEQLGVSPEILESLRASNTARHFSEIVMQADFPQIFDKLCQMARDNCRKLSGGKLEIDCFMLDFDGKILGRAQYGG